MTRRRSDRWLVGAAVMVALVVPGIAWAGNSAEAEQLFREGRALMKEGKYAEACTAFEASQRADPSNGTLANLADCREKNLQLATAWGAFLDLERATRGDEKQAQLHQTAKDRAARLEPRLSYLTVSVPEESKVDGLVLTRNGDELDVGMWNRKIPVDGGEYKVAGRAPGHEEWSTTVTVPKEGGNVSVDVPKFKAVKVLMKKPGDEKPGEMVEGGSALTGQRKAAIGVGAVGVLAIGSAIVFGVQSNGLHDDAAAKCPQGDCPSQAAADDATALEDRARSKALFADISIGVAAAAAITAGVLWFTGAPAAAGGETALAPVVGPSMTGVAFVGRF